MSQKEILFQDIKDKFQELRNYTNNNNISNGNTILEEIQNAENNIIQFIKDNKIEKSELKILDDEDQKKFLKYYSEIYHIDEGSLQSILNDVDNNYEKALGEMKKKIKNNESED